MASSTALTALQPSLFLLAALSVLDESLNTLADQDTTSELYLYGSILPAMGRDGRNKLFVGTDFSCIRIHNHKNSTYIYISVLVVYF